jgi:hypothetical protein
MGVQPATLQTGLVAAQYRLVLATTVPGSSPILRGIGFTENGQPSP